jgi:CubicO group peptidase (beta-lactamase class C family)
MVTPTTALRLVEREQLRLDQPLIEILPAKRRTKAMTAEHRLHHLPFAHLGARELPRRRGPDVGFVRRGPGSDPGEQGSAAGRHAARFADLPAEGPGEKYLYADANFILAGLVIEAVTGKSFYEVATEEVLRPAAVRDRLLHAWAAVKHPTKELGRTSPRDLAAAQG